MASLIGPKSDVALAEAAAAAGRAAGVCEVANDSTQRWPTSSSPGLRPRSRIGHGKKAKALGCSRHSSQCIGPVSLFSHAAGGGGNGHGPCADRDRRAARALVANVTARPTLDPDRIQFTSGRAGHRAGSLARRRGVAGKRR